MVVSLKYSMMININIAGIRVWGDKPHTRGYIV